MKSKGFFLLESLLVFSLGVILLLACLRTSKACLVTMQKKILLEEAILATDLYLTNQALPSQLEVIEHENTAINTNFTLKEVQVKHEDKVILTMSTMQ